jgi:hypothetical protein
MLLVFEALGNDSRVYSYSKVGKGVSHHRDTESAEGAQRLE